MKHKESILMVVAGALIGVVSLLLVQLGNPANMGLCIACFLRDTTGALGMHGAPAVQYVRPEIAGIVIGAMLSAVLGREFVSRGGSSPMTRFVLGAFVMVGALMFLGCPTRMILRLAGGDLNALVGLVGFAGGILCGTLFLNKGFSLKKAHEQTKAEGFVFPVVVIVLLALSVIVPTLFKLSTEGPGSMRAPLWAALILAVLVGFILQRSRICTVGAFRDAYMFRDFHLMLGVLAIFVTVVIGNLVLGSFNLGFADQPVAHSDGLWNFLGMLLVGFASCLLGGCPMRQLTLAGSGNSDSAVTVLGMCAGAALCHNMALASSAAGPTTAGRVAVIACLLVTLVIAFVNMPRKA